MTEPLFAADAYRKEFTAQVTAIDPEKQTIALDQTAFFPGGGGQPCDIGTIRLNDRELPVNRVFREGETILHSVEGGLPEAGDEVTGVIDWERRYAIMRTHTALHILCGVIWQDYQAQVTGGNMEPLHGRLDFEFESMRAELVREIEEKINREMEQGRTVKVRILPRQEAMQIPDLIRTKINLLPASLEEIRTIEIEGLDLQADGGTHVANTREVGPIRIVKHKSKGRINKRVEIALDRIT